MSDTTQVAAPESAAARPPEGAPAADAPPAGSVAAQILPLLDAIDRQLQPDSGEFVGRAYLRDVIGVFQQSRNRMLVMAGPPGVGKTAFAAQLVRERLGDAQPYLAHFCSLPDGESPLQFCLNIARQLKSYLGDEYRPAGALGRQLNVAVNVNVGQAATDARVVGVEIKELKLGDTHPREAFRALVREPLQAYHTKFGHAPGERPLMIIIDALDRVWQWDGGQSTNIVSVLSDVQDLPEWVNFVCMARPGAAVQALRAQAGVRVWDIGATTDENRADIAAYLRERLIGGLAPEARARLDAALAGSDLRDAAPSAADALVARVVDASQGAFSFVRRYAGALRMALAPEAGAPQIAVEPLLRLADRSLDSALDASYAAIYAQLRPTIDAAAGDADEEVLGTLAIAFEPLTLAMLVRMSAWRGQADDLSASLGRLAAVLATSAADGEPAHALYHSGFADYVRRQQPMGGRERDMRVARLLEQSSDDPQLERYSARHRWGHLLRGLDVGAARAAAGAAEAAPARDLPAPDLSLSWRAGVSSVLAIAPDPVTQAQLLRMLAARALDPSEQNVQGSWTAALTALRQAVRILEQSRAVRLLQRRAWHVEGDSYPRELIELEQTLIALGDAYRGIAQRMDVGGRQYDDWVSERQGLYIVWDAVVRLPLTLYLLLTLASQGVREIHIPGALQNLGRGQDWTIARLYVQSVSTYRRARALVRQRGDEELEDDIVERLARTYMVMGAYDAAAATYDTLLARPAALSSPWRKAIWLHALGDVLLARRRAERAAEVLTSALLTFKGQEAPVLQARALSSLAGAHAQQARLAELRGDTALSSELDDTALRECDEALTAWHDVTRLEGDEGASVDPALAKSRIGNLLWRLARSERLANEQIRKAEALRESIGDRHFPQRFEHPLLRLFRVLATLLLPAFLLIGLLLAVQSQSAFLVNTRTELALQPPLVDLSLFPNNLVSGGASQPGALTASDLTRLIAGANWRQFAPAPPQLSAPSFDFLQLTSTGLMLLGAYLLLYLIFGLGFLQMASPAHHQSRRPGRLVLSGDQIIWLGQRPLGIWRETLRWGLQELLLLLRAARRWLAQAVGLEAGQLDLQVDAAELRIPLAQVRRAVALERRERQRLLGDFSSIELELEPQPGSKRHGELHIPGSMAFYDELSDELSERLGARWSRLTVEIFRSVSGLVFFATLLYTLALSLLSSSFPELLQRPLPRIGYSFSDLYIITAPGLLLPLIWWFLVQPLAARVARGHAALALTLTSALGALLTALVLLTGETANLLRVHPDLFTPTLAGGVLVGLVLNAPVRPLYRALAPGWGLLRTAVALAALAGLFLLAGRVGQTLAWYDALVRGTAAVRQALASPECADTRSCAELDSAAELYARMICLQPGATEGYAYRGFVRVVQQRYGDARQDFFDAIRTADGRPPPADGCFPPVARSGSGAEIARLHANLAGASTLEAREQAAYRDGEPFYQEALLHELLALRAIDGGAESSRAARILAELEPGEALRCHDLARELLDLTPEQARGLSSPRIDALDPEQAPFVLQLADTCYSRGFSQARSIASTSPIEREAVRRAAWDDLTAAVAQYEAVAGSIERDDDAALAVRGMAAAWLILGQFEPLPPGAPDRRSYLLRAFAAYDTLEHGIVADEAIFAGKAWSIILLDAWNDASAPLSQAASLNPQNATYPALQGLVAWLDSTKYRAPSRTVPSPDYTAALNEAVRLYTRSIELSDPPRSQAYATRAVLLFSLRNSPRDEEYADPDYGFWMQQALADMDQALLLAEREGLSSAEQVGYRYWRGRLAFTLALTWQRKLRGLHRWDELVPLYSRTIEDFNAAVEADPEPRRRADYTQLRIPWASYMLSNAAHMQAAEQALRLGDYELARRELDLVVPTLTPEQKQRWDRLSEPRPEFALLHGLTSLALEEPEDFVNPQTGTFTAEESFDLMLEETLDDTIVDPRARVAFLQYALNGLDSLRERAGLTEGGRALVARVRARIEDAIAAAQAEE